MNQHGAFHIFRTQSYNNITWKLFKDLMKDKTGNKHSKIPLEN